MRWANDVIQDLESFGVDTHTLTPRILLRESNSLTVNETDGLRYLDQAFNDLLKRLNISQDIHPALLTHREAFFSSSAARIERLQKEGATYINQVSFFKSFRERTGITVSTIHGVKGPSSTSSSLLDYWRVWYRTLMKQMEVPPQASSSMY